MTGPATTTAEAAAWRAAVDRALKGASYEAVMTSATADGLIVQPLYPKAEDAAPQPLRPAGRVGIVARLDHPDPGATNGLAREEVRGGASGLTIVLEGSRGARGFGLSVKNGDMGTALFDAVLAGIDLGAVVIQIEAPPRSIAPCAEALATCIEARAPGPAATTAEFGLGADEATLALALRRRGFAGALMRADGRPTHEAGGTEAQELAALLAQGTAALRALDDAGASPQEMGELLSFVIVADTDFLLTVAKLRAARRLWACVAQACGLEARPLRLHAETAWRSMTRHDPWTNLLRGSVAAAGALMGGADSLAVLPFTAPLGLPDAFARRLARNTGHILQDEAHLGRLADPAGGAGAFEALTEGLCDSAWSAFQAIESVGGYGAALRSGFWPARVAESRARRHRHITSGERPILGVSLFPPSDAAVPPVLMQAKVARAESTDGLPTVRDAEGLEGVAAQSVAAGAPR